jgi:branched-chain amino acid aminotransferase
MGDRPAASLPASVAEHVVFLDGRQVSLADARVSVFDHGFLFGDSVYEVVRTVTPPGARGRDARRLFAFDPHMDRLDASARGISLELPWTRAELRSQVDQAAAAIEKPGDVYVRIIVTRGVGEIDLAPDSSHVPGLIVIAKPLPTYPRTWYDDGIALQLVATMRNPARATNPGIKSGNYLNNVLALMEARRAGALDAAMLNERGFLTECTTSNIFIGHEGVLATPSLECGILSGITRSIVLDLARRGGIAVREGELSAEDLRTSDEAFITSTTKDLVPVATVNGARLRRSPGPLTRRLSQLFHDHVQSLIT